MDDEERRGGDGSTLVKDGLSEAPLAGGPMPDEPLPQELDELAAGEPLAEPAFGAGDGLPVEDDSGEQLGFELALDLDDIGRPRVPGWVSLAEPEDLALALEAVCFVLNRAVTLSELAGILGRSGQAVGRAADALASQVRGRGLMLQRHLDQVQLVTRPEVAWAVQRALNPEKPARLSRPALETLAIVAYRQPATRGVIESIRGVNCETVLESLERRGLIIEVGRAETPGQPRLFGTTLRFLQLVGLETIDQLPAVEGAARLAADGGDGDAAGGWPAGLTDIGARGRLPEADPASEPE